MNAAPTLPLPAGWNIHRDLVVLVGRGVEIEAAAWLAAGQQRILVYLLDEERPPSLPYPAVIARTRVEVLQTINNYPGNPPERVKLNTADDQRVTREILVDLSERIKECLRSRHLNLNTLCVNGPDTLVRCLENAKSISSVPSIASLANVFQGKPCVIVSPGPSLSKNIHLLEKVKGHAVVVTGTHALASFRSAGVVPDIVLAADPGDLRRHYDASDLSEVEAMLVSSSCQPYNFTSDAKRTFSFAGNPGSDDWIFEPFKESAQLATGGSVACSAFSLAYLMGCDPIVLVGQDLSFPNGKYYASENLDGESQVVIDDGTFHLRKPTDEGSETKRFTISRDTVEVPGYHGGTVPSSDAFRAFLFWFEACIESLDGTRRVWNCTEGGARIAGADQRTLQSALEELEASQARVAMGVDMGVADALDQRIEGVDIPQREHQLGTYLEGLLSRLEHCEQLAAKAKGVLPDAYENGAALEQFESIEKELSAAVRPLQVIALMAQREIIAATEEAQTASSYEANLAASGRLIDLLSSSAAAVREPLERAIDRQRG